MENTLFTYDEFYDFVYSYLIRTFGKEAKIEKDNDRFVINIVFDENIKTKIFLDRGWENYQRTGDIGDIVNGYTHMVTSFNDASQFNQIQNLIPLLRCRGTITNHFANIKKSASMELNGKIDLSTIKLIFENVADGIELIYAFDSPKAIIYAITSQFPDNMEIEQAKAVAQQNLITQGWVMEKEVQPFSNGSILIYSNNERPFSAQFLIREMYFPHIGDHFYVSFPNNNTVLVYRPYTYILNDAKMLRKGLNDFGVLTKYFYQSYQSPLSPNMYCMNQCALNKIG